METLINLNPKVCEINLSKYLNNSSCREFQYHFEQLIEKGERHIQLNLAEITIMQTTLLGILLLVHEKATLNHASIELTQCSNSVKKILEIANYGKLFKIS